MLVYFIVRQTANKIFCEISRFALKKQSSWLAKSSLEQIRKCCITIINSLSTFYFKLCNHRLCLTMILIWYIQSIISPHMCGQSTSIVSWPCLIELWSAGWQIQNSYFKIVNECFQSKHRNISHIECQLCWQTFCFANSI